MFKMPDSIFSPDKLAYKAQDDIATQKSERDVQVKEKESSSSDDSQEKDKT